MIERPIHVAILDDDRSIRTALGRFLKSAGKVAYAYATSDELFESVALKYPDCLLLDFQMPRMSGLDVLRHLNQRHIRIPTIMMTAYNDADARSACLNAGAIAYLRKPLDPEQLIQTIDEVFDSPQPDKVFPSVHLGAERSRADLSTRQRRLMGHYSSPDPGKITQKFAR